MINPRQSQIFQYVDPRKTQRIAQRVALAFTVLAYVCLGNASSSLASEPKSTPGSSSVNLLPPHVVIYLDNGKNGEADREEITSHGMTFRTVIAAVTGPKRHGLAFDTGTLFSRTQPQPEQPRGLSEYMKLKGYRLMMLGNDPLAEAHDFAFENISDSVNSIVTPHKDDRLAIYLDREVKRDHRPVCLVINGSGLKEEFSPTAVFQASRKVLPVEQTVFVYSALEPGATVETTAATFEPSCEQALTLPLTVVWDKHVDTNRISDGLISSIDLLPTIVELTGGTPPSEIDGRSFAGLLRGESFEHRDVLFCALYEHEKLTNWTARDARFKFVSDDPSGTSGKLYDLLSDAGESNDLSQDPAFVNRSTELRDQLQLWIKRH